jgi:hypothetical protein
MPKSLPPVQRPIAVPYARHVGMKRTCRDVLVPSGLTELKDRNWGRGRPHPGMKRPGLARVRYCLSSLRDFVLVRCARGGEERSATGKRRGSAAPTELGWIDKHDLVYKHGAPLELGTMAGSKFRIGNPTMLTWNEHGADSRRPLETFANRAYRDGGSSIWLRESQTGFRTKAPGCADFAGATRGNANPKLPFDFSSTGARRRRAPVEEKSNKSLHPGPRVARSSQPWASGQNTFGVHRRPSAPGSAPLASRCFHFHGLAMLRQHSR